MVLRKITSLILAAVFGLSACGTPQAEQLDSTVFLAAGAVQQVTSELTPDTGAEVIAIDGSPQVISDVRRIVAIAPGVSEILFSLGLRDYIVGRDIADNAPELQNIPVVTQAHSANLESIISVQPTLVLVDANTRPISVLEQLSEFGIQVVEVPLAIDLKSAQARLDEIGRILSLDAIELSRLQLFAQPKVKATGIKAAFVYLRGNSAIYLVGGAGSGADAMIEAAGGIDVGAAAGLGAFTPITPELFAELNPEVLIVMREGLESVGGSAGLFAIPGIKQTDAAKAQRLIVVEDYEFLSFGAKTLPLLVQLNSTFRAIKSESS